MRIYFEIEKIPGWGDACPYYRVTAHIPGQVLQPQAMVFGKDQVATKVREILDEIGELATEGTPDD